MNNWNRLESIGNKTDVHDAMRRPDVLESPTKNIADHQIDVLKQVCDKRSRGTGFKSPPKDLDGTAQPVVIFPDFVFNEYLLLTKFIFFCDPEFQSH